VKPAAFDYAAPTSLDDALGLLAANDRQGLAGGQGLIRCSTCASPPRAPG
jgi:CO/xanthine dehydrogenase FAD-binding subunit